MDKEKVSKFVNPLWIIVILLIVMNFLLWDISQKIGRDFAENPYAPPTGLYGAIYYAMNEIDNELNTVQALLEDLLDQQH